MTASGATKEPVWSTSTPMRIGASPDSCSPPPTGGRFVLREVLGQGTFGRVYRAYDPRAAALRG